MEPKDKATPLMRWAIDIIIVNIGRYTCKCGDNGRTTGLESAIFKVP
jgi:hypothetical protein